MTDDQQREQRHAQRFGWTSLTVWALLGVTLEALHGFKQPWYLHDELSRMLLRLGHAHGALLSLVVLVYSVAALPVIHVETGRTPLAGRLLRWASVLLPVGFCLSAFGHPEGDPGVPIVLVPIGGVLLIAGLLLIARAQWQRPQ